MTCSVCHRALRTRESVWRGIGPVCATRVGPVQLPLTWGGDGTVCTVVERPATPSDARQDAPSPLPTWCWTTCKAWARDRRPTDTLAARDYRGAAAALRAIKRGSLLTVAYLWSLDDPQLLHRVLLHERQPAMREAVA